MNTRFADRVAIVTASSRGIGRATALRLSAEGAAVVLNGRNSDTLDATVSEVEATGGRAVGVVGSVEAPDTASRLVAAAFEAFGRLDHLVNNIGISPHYGPMMSAKPESLLRAFRVNVGSPIGTIQEAVQAGLGDRDGGSIVNVSTIGARQVQPLLGPYIASKAALDTLSRVLARELGPRGIRINSVAPGLVRTDMAQVLLEGGQDEREAEILPLQRIGAPEDVAGVVAFLLSADAAWMTGSVVDVDGGRLLVGDEPRELIGVYEPSTGI